MRENDVIVVTRCLPYSALQKYSIFHLLFIFKHMLNTPSLREHLLSVCAPLVCIQSFYNITFDTACLGILVCEESVCQMHNDI